MYNLYVYNDSLAYITSNPLPHSNHAYADMLEIGNGMSAAEERSLFALWAVIKSPLIIGTNISQLSTSKLAILKPLSPRL